MKRLRQNWILWVLAVAMMCYVFFLPLMQNLYSNFVTQPTITRIEAQTLIEIINQRLIEGLFAGLFFSFGAALGSFLNVVAYRIPLNRSIVFQPSKCPKCNQRIAGKDNFPVLGWFMLKGKCRNCRSPISARYPIVEAIVGSIFLLLFFRQLISGGANLPIRDLSMYRGVVWTLMYMKWDLFAIYVYHVTWFVLMVVWVLFTWDGNRIPKRVWVFALLALLIPPTILNYLPQVPFDFIGGQTRLSMNPLTRALATVGFGAGCGLLLAVVVNMFFSPFLGGFKKPEASASPRGVTGFITIDSAAFASEIPLDEAFVCETPPAASETPPAVSETPPAVGETTPAVGDLTQVVCSMTQSESATLPTNCETPREPTTGTIPQETKAADSSAVLQDSVVFMMISTGIVVGWQGLLAITCITMVGRGLCRLDRSNQLWQSVPFAGWFLIAALIHHVVWRDFSSIW